MSKKEKLLKRIKQKPRDFTYTELETLLINLIFKEVSKGKTSGSRVEFLHEEKKIKLLIHKPHPSNIIKQYVIESVLKIIQELEEKSNG